MRCSKVVSAPSQSRHKGGNIRIPVGRHLRKFIPIPEDFITNNAFGGAGHKDALRDRRQDLLQGADGHCWPPTISNQVGAT